MRTSVFCLCALSRFVREDDALSRLVLVVFQDAVAGLRRAARGRHLRHDRHHYLGGSRHSRAARHRRQRLRMRQEATSRQSVG